MDAKEQAQVAELQAQIAELRKILDANGLINGPLGKEGPAGAEGEKGPADGVGVRGAAGPLPPK
jgi:hypothetical protein